MTLHDVGCHRSQVENEAVVAQVLRLDRAAATHVGAAHAAQAADAAPAAAPAAAKAAAVVGVERIEVEDLSASGMLSGLHPYPGVATWSCSCSASKQAATDGEQLQLPPLPLLAPTGAPPAPPPPPRSLQPPSADEVWMAPQLRRCVRLMPHGGDDCSGFFVALLRKPEAPAEAPAEATVAGAGAAGKGKEAAEASEEAEAEEAEETLEAVAEAEEDFAEAGVEVARAEGEEAGKEAGEAGEEQMELLGESTWRSIAAFYGIDVAATCGLQMLRTGGRTAQREKLYCVSSGDCRR